VNHREEEMDEHVENVSVNHGKGKAVIIAGSGSDIEHVRNISKALNVFKIPHIVRICSAHKQIYKLSGLLEELNRKKGPLVIISVAGFTDALSGVLSFYSIHPVLSCPPDKNNFSALENPSGSSNATIFNPSNVARFIAQMFSCFNIQCREILEKITREKIAELDKKDEEILLEYGDIEWEV